MKKYVSLFLVLAVLSATVATAQVKELKNEKEKLSYAMAMNIIKSLMAQGIELDEKIFQQGVTDTYKGKNVITEDQMFAILQEFTRKNEIKKQAKAMNDYKQEKSIGDEFHAKKKNEKGVTTLPSGLQYKILQKGTGNKPAATSTVKVHYEGTLIDGTVFDSSYKRGEPAVFPLNRVISGWTEVLQLMPEKSVWEVYIPENLAYGQNPPPGSNIKAGSTLVFKIELISIEK